MTENIDPLKKALAENGAFDHEKVQQITADAVSGFHAKLKKAERIYWIYIILCVAVFVSAFKEFEFGTSTKAVVGYGILMLIAYETIVLMKLWYWISNNKVNVLKEIKLLRLQILEKPTESIPASVADVDQSDKLPWRGLSRWERIAWFAVLVLVTLFTSTFMHNSQLHVRLNSENYITLEVDGSGMSINKISYKNWFSVPLTSISDFMPDSSKSTLRWLDAQGRVLPYDVSTVNGQKQYTVRLVEPVMPGEDVNYTQITEDPASATKEGNIWTYKADQSYGNEQNDFFQTIQLPPGAAIVSVDPKSDSQFQSTGPKPDAQATYSSRPTLTFKAIRNRNEPFKYTIKYRLPGDTKP